jgi:hypothetical protein
VVRLVVAFVKPNDLVLHQTTASKCHNFELIRPLITPFDRFFLLRVLAILETLKERRRIWYRLLLHAGETMHTLNWTMHTFLNRLPQPIVETIYDLLSVNLEQETAYLRCQT